MKALLQTVLLMCASPVVIGQCGMSVSVQSFAGCQPGLIFVNTTGGTGPYVIALSKLPFNTPVATVNDADGDYNTSAGGYEWEATDGVRVVVTDAMNCTATADGMHDPFTWGSHFVQPPQLVCATGVFKVSMMWGVFGAPATFRVDNGPVQNVAGNWTTNGSLQVLNAVLAPGDHTITFPQYNGPGVIVCESSNSVQVPAPVSPGDCNANLRVRAALDGALPSGTIMTDGLRTANLIPTIEPYTALGYSYVGSPSNLSIPPSLLAVTGNDAIVDWVLVEVRNPVPPYAVVFSKPGLLQRDGDVIDIDGDLYLSTPLSTTPTPTYHVAIRHRNHLGAMKPVSFTSAEPAFVNFTVATGTFGANATVLKGTLYCLWAGDATGNGQLRYTGSANDRDPILLAVGSTTPNNTLPNVYDRGDTNLDGVIKYTGTANDRDIILTNVGSTTPNNTRTQQLP